MKKTTSSLKLSKQLAKYGALTAAMAGVADASGQIVYTDVDPDFAGGIGSSMFLDLDNNGTNDFQIIHDGGDDLDIVPVNNVDNEVLGVIGYSSSWYGYFYGFAYPYVLSNNDVISNGATGTWNNFGYNSVGTNSLNFGSCIDGYWCDVTDGYLGLRFNIGGNVHYGWARLDVDTAGDVWTLKDYAYNTVAGESILAGQQTLSTDSEILNESVRVTALNKTIGLYNLPNKMSYQLFSMTGKAVLNGHTENSIHSIEAKSLSDGVYIIEITDNNTNAVIRKKIVL